MINRYWRGTINVHFIIAGHPFVEVEFTTLIRYHYNTASGGTISLDQAQHQSLFPGSKHIVVPLPYLSHQDYMPVEDAYPAEGMSETSYTTKVHATLRVVSFMTNVEPNIPFYVYVSAGPDFAFYSPIPPGLYNVDELSEIPEKPSFPRSTLLLEQVNLMPVEAEIARTRAAVTTDPGILPYNSTIFDYMKMWSRCVPFKDYDNDADEEPIPDANVGFTHPTWYPPIDRTEDEDVNNSWYFTLDYIAYFSSMFLYFRGDMGFKIVISSENRPQSGFVFVSLGDPVVRQKTHCPFGYLNSQVPPQSNFGAGTVITPQEKQPVLDFSLPYRGSNVWSYANYNAYTRPFATTYNILPNAAVNHNLVLQNDDDVLCDAVFRKIGPNFALAVETGLPPPTMWVARGFDWSS
jgi:hypothetical protein